MIAQAIDESRLADQVGTLAGDNTLLVLFADEPALERWRARFIVARSAGGRRAPRDRPHEHVPLDPRTEASQP